MAQRHKTFQYTAVFEKNEDNGYTVTVPALPGLVTEGKNLTEARTMVADAIQCYLEGLRKERKKMPQEGEVGNFRVSVEV